MKCMCLLVSLQTCRKYDMKKFLVVIVLEIIFQPVLPNKLKVALIHSNPIKQTQAK